MRTEPARRSAKFFRRLATLALLTASAFGVTALGAAEARPNFIVIITDDQQWAAMSCVQREHVPDPLWSDDLPPKAKAGTK